MGWKRVNQVQIFEIKGWNFLVKKVKLWAKSLNFPLKGQYFEIKSWNLLIKVNFLIKSWNFSYARIFWDKESKFQDEKKKNQILVWESNFWAKKR